MVWLLDAMSFVAWICLSAPYMVTKDERDALERGPRREGLREVFALVGLFSVIGHLFSTHRWWYALLFIFVVGAPAFLLRFITDSIPTWALGAIVIVTILGPGFGWLR
jgi:hypothetical protein